MQEDIIRLDMSEYMERHTVAKLIGAPPGFVGYGEGGKLTEAVRRRPFAVVLFDEIEKAHPDVFNVLLQVCALCHCRLAHGVVQALLACWHAPVTLCAIRRARTVLLSPLIALQRDARTRVTCKAALQVMEDGRLTDSAGRTVSFKDTVIVLTSNVGSHLLAKGGHRHIGFGLDDYGADDGAAAARRLRCLVIEELKAQFRPEFLNRLDEVVVRTCAL